MNEKPIGAKFLEKAKDLIPHHYNEIAETVTDSMNEDQIDATLFSKSEYMGGMAAVIIELVNRES